MPDISKITASDGVTYNIKDTTKTASTGTTQGMWYKIAEGSFPDNGERLDLLFAVSSGTDNVYSGIYNFTVETVDNARDINLLVYVRNQMVYTYDTTAVSDANTWAIYQFLRTGYTRSITWTIISENINTSANPPYILYNNPTPEASIPASYSYQTTPGIGGEIGGVYQQNTTDNTDMPVLLGSDSNYVYKNSNIAVNPSTGNLQATQLNGATIGNSPVFTDTKVTQTVENGSSVSGDYYSILLANTKLSDNTETAGVKKTPCSDLAYSPTDHRIRLNGKTSSYGASIGGFVVYGVNNNGVNIQPNGINLFDTSYNDTITLTNTTGAITATSLNGATIGNPPRWEGTQAQYDALTTYDPNTIYYITDGVSANVSVINDLSDVSISSPQNGQYLIYNSASQMWTNASTSTACSISAGPNMPSDFPVPNIARRGNIVQIRFALLFPAGTYTNTDVLWKYNPVIAGLPFVNVPVYGSGQTNLLIINPDGTITLNSSKTFSSDTWFINVATCLTDGVYI